MKKKLVVLSGAGISAESGIKTFRDSDGLWENHDIMEVASPDGWRKNKEIVLEFYNQRRKQAQHVSPNAAHYGLADLENDFDVTIITQNIDNLHERAGSSKIIHLHGELFKSQSTLDPNLVYDMDSLEIKLGDKCEKGSQLRPFIVWFGEMVPMMDPAIKATQEADIFVVIGTSLLVYPAASLLQYTNPSTPTYIIDINIPETGLKDNLTVIQETASKGVSKLKEFLI
ncbi:SIR2 family NAD-dependent protein deacylase [Echinicola salinicaeni]|uniref:SIR2 family NAD-dependent protein deacylase n=1 Tax=Echinicola salinicaeni TaxID=2762757 RepID=UPI001647BD0A|nr:NAD-dependent deacylase [Echinicola salinicaeni]